MSRIKKRNKSGKITGWVIHVVAEFRRDNDDVVYCERASFSIPIRNQRQVSHSPEFRDVVAQWAKDTRTEGNYNSKFHMGVEMWTPLRGA